VGGGTERYRCLVCAERELIPHIIEIHGNTEMERGDSDKQVTAFQLENSNQDDADCHKCQ
jgi:hypothetical protein